MEAPYSHYWTGDGSVPEFTLARMRRRLEQSRVKRGKIHIFLNYWYLKFTNKRTFGG